MSRSSVLLLAVIAATGFLASVVGMFVGREFFAPQAFPPVLLETRHAQADAPDADDVQAWWDVASESTREIVVKRASVNPHEARLHLRYAATKQAESITFGDVEPFLLEIEFHEPLEIEHAVAAGEEEAAWNTLAHVSFVSWLWIRFGPFPEHAGRISAAALRASEDGEDALVAYATSLLKLLDRGGFLDEGAQAELDRLRENEYVELESDRVLDITTASARRP